LLLGIVGFGCLGGVGLVYVGVRAGRPSWWIPGIGYALAGWLGFVLVGSSDPEAASSDWGVAILLLAGLAALLHAVVINTSWLQWRARSKPWYAASAAPAVARQVLQDQDLIPVPQQSSHAS
jgi:hypothetical protein